MLNLSKLMAGLKDKDKFTPSGPHPFKKMIKGIWPFNESFKNLKWYQKIIEILKVSLPSTAIRIVAYLSSLTGSLSLCV